MPNKPLQMPAVENHYQGEHAHLLLSSYHHWTGKSLVDENLRADELYRALFEAPFALVSHNTEQEPVFNYGNQTALSLFDMEWADFTRLPSRKSAEPVNRAERDRLMSRVTRQGYIDDYRGVRISSAGKRFLIEEAVVWNVVDAAGRYHGQAAVFHDWTLLPD